jgi:intein-encoded DNA endonuclease-like protein
VSLNTKDWRMADRLAQGRLALIVAEWRSEGQSHEAIVRRLYADFGIEVTRQTLAKWIDGIEKAGVGGEAA